MHYFRDYFPEAGLKARGWTDAMIKEFDLWPVKKVDNPYYRQKAKMKLYSKRRVLAIEKTLEFKERMALKRKRSEALTKPVEGSLPIEFPTSPESTGFAAKLKERLRQHYEREAQAQAKYQSQDQPQNNHPD